MNQFFQTWKTFYLVVKHSLKVCIEISKSLESFETKQGSKQFSNQDLNFEKHFCSIIGQVLNHEIQLKYYRLPCYSICSDNKSDRFLSSDDPGKPDF